MGPSPCPLPQWGGGTQRYTLAYNSAASLNPAKTYKPEILLPLKGGAVAERLRG